MLGLKSAPVQRQENFLLFTSSKGFFYFSASQYLFLASKCTWELYQHLLMKVVIGQELSVLKCLDMIASVNTLLLRLIPFVELTAVYSLFQHCLEDHFREHKSE